MLYGEVPSATYADGAMVTLPAPATWAAMPTIGVEAANLPAEVTSAEFGAATLLGGSRLCDELDDVVVPAGGTATFATPYVPGGDGYRVRVAVIAGTSGQDVIVHGDVPPALVSVDGAGLLPWVSAPALESAPTRVTWTETASGGTATADLRLVVVSYEPVAGGNAAWVLVAPPGGTTLELPALPASAAAWSPEGAAISEGDVILIDAVDADGYRALRPRLLGSLEQLSGGGDTRAIGDLVASRVD
ncbi:MAG: hypothetical protein R2939_07430 [Kofleriaceae bacterium]